MVKNKLVFKKSIIILVLTIANGICSFLFASNMYIDRMPPVEKSLFQEIASRWLIPSLLLSIITTFLYYIIMKKLLKQNIQKSVVIVLFLGLFLANFLIYALNVNIVY